MGIDTTCQINLPTKQINSIFLLSYRYLDGIKMIQIIVFKITLFRSLIQFVV